MIICCALWVSDISGNRYVNIILFMYLFLEQALYSKYPQSSSCCCLANKSLLLSADLGLCDLNIIIFCHLQWKVYCIPLESFPPALKTLELTPNNWRRCSMYSFQMQYLLNSDVNLYEIWIVIIKKDNDSSCVCQPNKKERPLCRMLVPMSWSLQYYVA